MEGRCPLVLAGFPAPDRHPLAGATNTNETALIDQSPRVSTGKAGIEDGQQGAAYAASCIMIAASDSDRLRLA